MLLLSPSPGRQDPDAARDLAVIAARLRAGGAELLRIEPSETPALTGAQPTTGGGADQPVTGTARPTGARLTAFGRSLWHTALGTRALGVLDCVVVGQADLIPVGMLAAHLTGARRVPVLFHGTDMWTMRPHLRWLLRRDPLLYPVTTSSFGAGALCAVSVGAVLAPGLEQRWRDTLLAEAGRRRPLPPVPTVLSVFRLDEWEAKGLPALVEAVAEARRVLGAVRLVVAGPGPAPGALHALVAASEHTELHENPGDEALARLYATADLFALCTRTRTSPPVSGEAYGLALLEAQLAGCAVIGPARGGARDAYRNGDTGWTPSDESPQALARVLLDLLADRARLTRAGRQAAEWASACTDPRAHTRAVFNTLLGCEPVVPAPAEDVLAASQPPRTTGTPAVR
ncbi:glycosyltransferase family 4 protein [Frankia sp. Mgl5]|uniref:glycosyltransferase family 4 protein n=1 Tax=Frankia sp. Mgl5 TaxID=2933793 RepID=UPI00200C0114|nr:glycosyltransferase family 4 protein [Frankia sp. Mgl5]MCK9932319.1 glycosyltransferase family 4 protein [Frankia sp. Mgl5]